MKSVLCFVFLFFIPYGFAQATNFEKVQKLYLSGEIENALSLIKNIDDSEISKLSKRDKINYYTEVAKANEIARNFPEAISNLLRAQKLNVNDSIHYQSIYVVELANVFSEIGAHNIAIEYIKKGLRLTNAPYPMFLHVNRIGAIYYQINELDSAMHYFQMQLLASKQLFKNAYSSSNNNIGLVLMKQEKYSDALGHFLIAAQKCDAIQDPDYFFVVQGNLGDCYTALGNTELAIKHMENYTSNTTNKFLQKAELELALLKHYLKLGKLNKAKALEARLKSFFVNMKTAAKISFTKMQYELFFYEKKYKQANDAVARMENYRVIQQNENLANTNFANSIVANYLISEARIKLSVLQRAKLLKQKTLVLEVKESYFFIGLTSTLCVLLGLFSALYFQNSRIQKKKLILEKEQLILEDERLKLTILKQESNLTDFAIDIRNKKEQNIDVIKNLNDLMNGDDSQLRNEIKSLIGNLKKQSLLAKNVEDLNEGSALLLLNFKNVLKVSHSCLTKAEIELCCLIKLNLSNKEIAMFRNISDFSVKTLKTRLKRKMQLSNTVSLLEYIQAVQ